MAQASSTSAVPGTVAGATATSRWRRLAAYAFGVAVLVVGSVVAAGACSSGPSPEDHIEVDNQELSTANRVQNVASFPFRVAGGAVVYPLKLLFVDIPNEIADALRGEYDEVEATLTGSDSPVSERLAAVAVLTRALDPEAVPLLTAALEDASAEVRRDAALAFDTYGPTLANLGNRHLRAKVEDRLGQAAAASVSVEGYLLAALRTEREWLVRASLFTALGTVGTDRAIPALREAYRDPNENDLVASFALLARGQRGDRRAEADALDEIASTGDPVIYSNALLALAYLGGDAARAELGRALAHPEQRVVIAAITGHGIAGNDHVLLSLLRDGSPLQRQKSAIALGQYGGAAYIGVLEQVRVTSPSSQLRRSAVFGLASAGYPRVVPYLIEIIDPRELNPTRTRLRAVQFLMELTEQSYGIDWRAWERWWSTDGGDMIEAWAAANPDADPVNPLSPSPTPVAPAGSGPS